MLAIVIILNHFNTFHDLSVFVRPRLAVTEKHHVISKGELCSSCWLRRRGGGGGCAAPQPRPACFSHVLFFIVFISFHHFHDALILLSDFSVFS